MYNTVILLQIDKINFEKSENLEKNYKSQNIATILNRKLLFF